MIGESEIEMKDGGKCHMNKIPSIGLPDFDSVKHVEIEIKKNRSQFDQGLVFLLALQPRIFIH